MTRRGLIARVLVLIVGCILAGTALLVLAVLAILDLGEAASQTELTHSAIYALASATILSAFVLGRLGPVLRVLGAWEQDQEPDELLLRRAQERALTFPNSFIIFSIIFILVLDAITVYVDVRLLGYELGPDLVNTVLVTAFALGIAFAVNIGIRALLRPFLRRISLPPSLTLPRFSVKTQVTLAVTLIALIMLMASGTLIYSSVTTTTDESVGLERARWLADVVVPLVQPMDAEERARHIAQLTRPGEEMFLLDRRGQYVGQAPTEYSLSEDEVRSLSQATTRYLYERDYSGLRVVAVPVDDEHVLCVVDESKVSTYPKATRTLRTTAVFSVGSLGFAFAVGLVTSINLSRTMRGVTDRLNTLSRETAFEQREPVSQTSMDEVGDLVQAYNRIQQRTNVHMGQLQETISQLEDANEQRQQLLESMVGLTALVIPVAKGLIVAPLSGYFGAERATHICPNLLEGIARHRAQMVILDLTGVTEASEPLANHLSRATRSAMLMGCEVVLTGAGPDLSWALTQMKTELDLLMAYRDLEGGLSYAYTRLSTLGLAEQETSP